MEQHKENHIQIKPMGSFFEVDSEGFLVNPALMEKIQETWRPVLDEYIKSCQRMYGKDLVSVYVRGSVAKGEAIEGISDFDAFVVLKDGHSNVLEETELEERMRLQSMFPFVNGFEFGEYTETGIKDEDLLINQSLHLFGEEIKVSPTKLSKDLAWHAPSFQSRHNKLLSFLNEENPSQSRIKNRVEWLGKGILRTGLEILIDQSGKYSRDLYPCYEVFAEYYPEKAKEMRAVLDLVLNPNTTQEKVGEILFPMSEFILQESKKVYQK